MFTRRCVRYAMRNYLQWSWGPVKPRKTKGDLDRRGVIVAYLRDLGRALKLERDGKAVLVYTDESYVHQNHCPSNSWVSVGVDGNIVDRGTSKGRRLIILHAITRDGPLVTYEGQGPTRKPIETLVWKPPGASLVSGGSPRLAVGLRLGDATSRHAGSLLSTRPVLNGEAPTRVEQQPHTHMRTAIRRLSAALRVSSFAAGTCGAAQAAARLGAAAQPVPNRSPTLSDGTV